MALPQRNDLDRDEAHLRELQRREQLAGERRVGFGWLWLWWVVIIIALFG